MTTPRSLLRPILVLCITFVAAVALHAQLPQNNHVWQTRCNLLAASATEITSGATPAALVAAARQVPGANFSTLAVDRAQAGSHYVACTLFYLAAIADKAGIAAKPDNGAASRAATLAAAELKAAHGQSLSFSEHMAWAGVKLSSVTGGPALAANDTQAVIIAASTMPLTLTPNTQEARVEPHKIP